MSALETPQVELPDAGPVDLRRLRYFVAICDHGGFTRAAAAPGGLELAGWVAEDAQSRRTSVRLSGQRYGVPAPADLFRITNPMAGPHH